MPIVVPIVVTGNADLDKLKEKLQQIEQEGKEAFRKTGDEAKKARAPVQDLEKNVKKLLTAFGFAGGITALAFGIRRLSSDFLDFGKSVAEVSTLVDTNVVDMKKLNDEILRLTTEVPQSAAQISRGLYQTISAGITDTSDALKVLEVSSKAAVAGVTDTNTAVNAITTVLNAYRKEVEEAELVSDIFFTTVREGKTTFPELSAGIGTVASSAALAGVTFEELAAAFATLTKTIPTELAATALNRLFLSIANPTEVLKKKTQALGAEFSASALRAKGFAGFMENLTKALEKDQDAIFELGLDMRAFRALAIIGGTGADEFREQVEKMNKALGAAGVAFDKMNDTGDSAVQLFKNELFLAFNEFAEVALPPVTNGLNQLRTNVFAPLREEFNRFKENIEGFSRGEFGRFAEMTRQENKLFDEGARDAVKETVGLVESLGQKTEEVKVKTQEAMNPFLQASRDTIPLIADELEEEVLPEMEEWSATIAGVKSETQKYLEIQRSIAQEVPPLSDNLRRASRETRLVAQGFADILLFSRSVEDTVKNIARALLSSGIQSFFGNLFPGAGLLGSGVFAADGIDFTVPSGFPNDSFRVPLNLTSGERVTVTPAGNNTSFDNSMINVNVFNEGGGQLDPEQVAFAIREARAMQLPLG